MRPKSLWSSYSSFNCFLVDRLHRLFSIIQIKHHFLCRFPKLQAYQAEQEGLSDSVLPLQVYMGLAWTVGCLAFGSIVVHNAAECRIGRQYLCQASIFMCALSILALTTIQGSHQGYLLFVWIYGIFCGGYNYSLKMYTYERVRARNFARTWGFVQCSQSIPIFIGVPLAGK